MGNIVLLDELTINKIAAGEVIERPASAVKEMVENSIDAGATNIQIEVKNGGISYIRITDNGKGIMLDDMEMAFERHATSKIRKAEDLEIVKSMGFRGEALASISAVANVELITRTANSEVGNRIVVEAGKTLEREEVGCPIGTTITVTNLFFNTPVRYKFLKKDFTELGYIEDTITRLALINPNIAFKLISGGKVIIQTNGNGKIQDIIYSIYGKEVAENILEVNYQYEDMIITGAIGKPSISRSNRGNQLFFVNNRYIKDKTVSSAIEKAYKGLLTVGKYAFSVINISMDPKKVDVNVHPAKLEVRFEEEGKIFKAIYHAVNDTLLKNDLIKDTDNINNNVEKNELNEVASSVTLFRKEISKVLNPVSTNTNNNIIEEIIKENIVKEEQEEKIEPVEKIVNEEKHENTNKNINLKDLLELQRKMKENLEKEKAELEENKVNDNIEEYKKTSENSEKKIDDVINKILKTNNILKENIEGEESIKAITEIEIPKKQMDEIINELNKSEYNEEVLGDFNQMFYKTFGKLPQIDNYEEKKEDEKINGSDILKQENISVFTEEVDEKYKIKYKFIGIAFSTYIILEMDNELYIMDQHAAHERIMYEKVKKNYYSSEKKDSQLMILPDIITLTHKEMGIAKENIELFEKAGFIIEEFGENTIKLSGTPSICLDLDTKSLFLETLDEINTVARTARQEIEEKFIATIACKAAVKANMALTKEEVDCLMDELLLLPNPFTCPHGRPTVIKMSKYDIERKFSRK